MFAVLDLFLVEEARNLSPFSCDITQAYPAPEPESATAPGTVLMQTAGVLARVDAEVDVAEPAGSLQPAGP